MAIGDKLHIKTLESAASSPRIPSRFTPLLASKRWMRSVNTQQHHVSVMSQYAAFRQHTVTASVLRLVCLSLCLSVCLCLCVCLYVLSCSVSCDKSIFSAPNIPSRTSWARLTTLTLSLPIPLRLYTLPYWSNPPFLIFDIRALWRSGLSARAPECQKLKMVG